MMKTLVLPFIFIIAVVSCGSIHEEACESDLDCPETKCCLPRGWLVDNICIPLAKKGEKCNEGKWMFHKNFEPCRCEAGLICKPEYIKDFSWGETKINQTCVEPDGLEETTAQVVTEVPDEV